MRAKFLGGCLVGVLHLHAPSLRAAEVEQAGAASAGNHATSTPAPSEPVPESSGPEEPAPPARVAPPQAAARPVAVAPAPTAPDASSPATASARTQRYVFPPAQSLPAAPIVLQEAVEARRNWYGWQTLSFEVACILELAAAVLLQSEELVFVSLATYGLAVPITHWAHGNAITGFISLGGRLVAPALVIAAETLEGRERQTHDAMVALGLLAIPAIVVIDAAVLAYDEPDEPSEMVTGVVPWFRPDGREVGLLVGGSF